MNGTWKDTVAPGKKTEDKYFGTDSFYCPSPLPSFDIERALSSGHFKSLEDFEEYFEREMLCEKEKRFPAFFGQLVDKYGYPDSRLSEEAGLATSYVGLIRNGRKNPSREVILRLCLVMGCDIDETQHLLKYAGHAPLYIRRKRDVVIWYGIMSGMTLDAVEQSLIDRGMKTLIPG